MAQESTGCHPAWLAELRCQSASQLCAPNRTPCWPMRIRARLRTRERVRKAGCYLVECVPAKNAKSIQREFSSWLSLATRSNASLGFLMRYW